MVACDFTPVLPPVSFLTKDLDFYINAPNGSLSASGRWGNTLRDRDDYAPLLFIS